MEKFFNWQRRQHSKSAIYSNWYKDTTETPKSNEPIVSNQNDVTIQISVQFQHRNNMINELRRPASSSNVTGSGRDRCLSTVCDVADKKRRATNTSDRMSTWNGPLEIADGHSDGRTDAICAAFILFAVYIFSLFLARHALLKVVIGQFVIGGLTVASGLDAKRLFKSNVKVFWLYEHKHSTREREREEISLSLLVALLCTCMESESRTSEESSFYLKGFFFPRAILFGSNFFVSPSSMSRYDCVMRLCYVRFGLDRHKGISFRYVTKLDRSIGYTCRSTLLLLTSKHHSQCFVFLSLILNRSIHFERIALNFPTALEKNFLEGFLPLFL